MKKILFLLALLFTISSFSQVQKAKYKTYSYTQLFKMIKAEKGPVFELKNAWIQFDSVTDMRHSFQYVANLNVNPMLFKNTDTIQITKELRFENVMFNRIDAYNKITQEALHHINFKEKVSFKNCLGIFTNNTFQKEATFRVDDGLEERYLNLLGIKYYYPLNIQKNKFKNGFKFSSDSEKKSETLPFQLFINDNIITNHKDKIIYLIFNSISNMKLNRNTFRGVFFEGISSSNIESAEWHGNDFGNLIVYIEIAKEKPVSNFDLSGNIFNKPVSLDMNHLSQENLIDWFQFKKGIILSNSFDTYMQNEVYKKKEAETFKLNTSNLDIAFDGYLNKYRYENSTGFREDTKFLGKFYDHYKSQHDMESANAVYIALKNVETNRLAFLHHKNPTFDTFFTWKINQFLKVFSAYGTKPSKSIIFSLYVIIFFAFVYFLFPNSWDKHGRKRFMNRFQFFEKYLRRKDGMHTLYLEDKKEEISSYGAFKESLENAQVELPHFFIAWSKPLYNASMFSSRIMTHFLKSTDILEGKWIDLTPKQKRWKNIQIGSLLILGLFYDLFIRALNALMLSINTFTTLGFGEIPIKGLPRYLAIIQGFIGWFMLTIFSVSLISQLLN